MMELWMLKGVFKTQSIIDDGEFFLKYLMAKNW